mgnify:FL=1
MDAGEYARWRVLEKIDPWGERRMDWRFALLASQVSALVKAKTEDGRKVRAIDCLLEFKIPEIEDEQEEPDPIDEELRRRARVANIEKQMLAFAKAHNARWAKKAKTKIIKEKGPET